MVLQQNSKRIGGKVKPAVRRKVMSQGKNHLAVQDAHSSASAAKKLISSTKIIHNWEPHILSYKDRNLFEGAIEVKWKMHMVEVGGKKTCLSQKCAFHNNSKPADTVLNKEEDMEVQDESIHQSIVTINIVDQMNLNPISYDDVKIGMWVINIYENKVDKR